MSKVYSTQLTVQPEHIDDLQHVNNVVYLQWVQDIAGQHWFSSSSHLQLDELVWVAREHRIEYFAPALLGENLALKTFVEKMQGVTSTRIVEIRRSGKLICKCSSHWILVDQQSMRPRRIPQEITDLFIWAIPKELVVT